MPEGGPSGSAAVTSLSRLKEVVLLGGSVRSSTLAQGIGRSRFDLPISNDRTLIQQWQEEVALLAGWIGLESLPIRMMLDAEAILPTRPTEIAGTSITVERDPVKHRGTGGILRDLALRLDPDDRLLVGSAAQVLIQPLVGLVNELAHAGEDDHEEAEPADVSVVAHDDGTPSGLMLVRCGALTSIPEVGYHDLKEQALPKIAETHRVGVVRRSHPGALPMPTLPEYIDALRWLHKGIAGEDADGDPYEEDWRPTFQIVEPSVQVKSEARIHDSVLLNGARVERGAVLVRSIVGPGAIIGRGEMVVDRLVLAPGAMPTNGSTKTNTKNGSISIPSNSATESTR